MNSIFIVVLSVLLFGAGYFLYARIISRLFDIDPARKTPAHTKFDGVDFVPARHWSVLFGHHFASISGAGPIVGPVIAVALWGWGPALLWIIFGTIFIGGVHDFGSLMVSVRHGGVSVAEAAQYLISKKAKTVFAVFVWLSLILVVAVFAFLAAKTFTAEPKVIIPSLGLIIIALFVGWLLYGLKLNHAVSTLTGIGSLAGLLVLSAKSSVSLPGGTVSFWSAALLVYAYIASITPVQILLQPRDYLSGFLLAAGVILGYGGLLISRPPLSAPFFTGFDSAEGYLWPMMFVTVACGAISGFHCLVASGTSSKQLANESQAKRIGYGSMAAEGIVAVLALLAVAAGITSFDGFSLMMRKGGPGPIGAFGAGFGAMAEPILGEHGGLVAITILNAFILTTLDSATRIARYLTEELFNIRNRYVATLIVVVLAGWLAMTGKWNMLWPVFGASNQLVAALALLVISCWLLSKRKPVLYTLIPCFFMFLTSAAALGFQAVKFIKAGDILLAAAAVVLLALAGYMVVEVIRAERRRGMRDEG